MVTDRELGKTRLPLWAGGFVVLGTLCFWGMTLMVAVSGGWRLTWATRVAFHEGAEERVA